MRRRFRRRGTRVSASLRWVGFLSNVDASVLKQRALFKCPVSRTTREKAIELATALTGNPRDTVDFDLDSNDCYSGKKHHVYLLRETVSGTTFLDDAGNDIGPFRPRGGWPEKDRRGQSEREPKDQGDLLQSLRLYRDGNIRMPVEYTYAIVGGKLKLDSGVEGVASDSQLYSFSGFDLADFERFRSGVHLPFAEDYLKLAHEYFESSFAQSNPHMAFLAAMIGLESLFNDGEADISFRISRALAVSLGTTNDESKIVFEKARKLYGLRSKVIHGGHSETVSPKDAREARSLLRRALVAVGPSRADKRHLNSLLNEAGFGSRPSFGQ